MAITPSARASLSTKTLPPGSNICVKRPNATKSPIGSVRNHCLVTMPSASTWTDAKRDCLEGKMSLSGESTQISYAVPWTLLTTLKLPSNSCSQLRLNKWTISERSQLSSPPSVTKRRVGWPWLTTRWRENISSTWASRYTSTSTTSTLPGVNSSTSTQTLTMRARARRIALLNASASEKNLRSLMSVHSIMKTSLITTTTKILTIVAKTISMHLMMVTKAHLPRVALKVNPRISSSLLPLKTCLESSRGRLVRKRLVLPLCW